jgi:hypothetical protein
MLSGAVVVTIFFLLSLLLGGMLIFGSTRKRPWHDDICMFIFYGLFLMMVCCGVAAQVLAVLVIRNS